MGTYEPFYHTVPLPARYRAHMMKLTQLAALVGIVLVFNRAIGLGGRHQVNGVGRVTWKARLEPGKPLEVGLRLALPLPINGPGNMSDRRILVIEDDSAIRRGLVDAPALRRLRKYWRPDGWRRRTGSGFARLSYDLMLLDLIPTRAGPASKILEATRRDLQLHFAAYILFCTARWSGTRTASMRAVERVCAAGRSTEYGGAEKPCSCPLDICWLDG
jgi:hypothetical protein